MLRAEVAQVTLSALSFVSPDEVQGETLRALSACAGGHRDVMGELGFALEHWT